MFTLFHHPFCPHSRFIRLILGEYGFDLRLIEERTWERREAFLALNPAGTTPVLFAEGMPAIPGAGVIAEYIDEAYGADTGDKRLLPATTAERIEVRRLMAWFNEKFFEEVSGPLVTERIYKRFMSEDNGGGAPATDVIRAANVRTTFIQRMPRAVRLGLTLALALLMMGALYLVAVRGEALLVDLSTLGQRLWCF